MDTPDLTTMKRCTECGKLLELSQFHKSKNSTDGHKARCKSCRCSYTRLYAQTHKEERRAYDAVWREKNRNSEKIRFEKYRERYRDVIRARNRAFYEKIKEQDREKRAQPENKRNKSEYDKARYRADPDCQKQRAREYRLLNLDKVRLAEKSRRADREHRRPIERNMRAKRRGAPGKHTSKDIALQKKAQGNRCWWCGKPITNHYHVDHRIPLARGGSNDPGNLVITCPNCNLRKNAKLPQEWNGRLL